MNDLQKKLECERLVNEGFSYKSNGDFDEAIIKYREALEFVPETERIRFEGREDYHENADEIRSEICNFIMNAYQDLVNKTYFEALKYNPNNYRVRTDTLHMANFYLSRYLNT
ncbi:MAG: tetratricopeptide repeat protein [Candidatus Poribacteria bacterium]|nr:tetratricopeptide repeat protein [Candidatus Poribacteria bacterium]